jgi:hypothetical protein
MAIVQISRITHRKGLIENLPQLAGGELGWAVDDRRLFIGNGTLLEGAPVIGNTEILTEFSDILSLASTYTYKGEAAGYAVTTGPDVTADVVRSLQEKFDDFASVKDFGAIGDGEADDTAAINRALSELFCQENNEEVRRSLFFPAGVYKVTATIKIPPYAKLWGEGANSSIIQYNNASPDDCVVRTTDSKQQTGSQIGSNAAIRPQNIEVSSMTFKSEQDMDILWLEKAEQCHFDSVNFTGPLRTSDINGAGDSTAAIRIISSTAYISRQVTFDKCHLSGLTYGLYADYNCTGITLSNGQFRTLYKGVLIGNTKINGGPRGVRILQNLFDGVYAQGIEIGDVNLNVSGFNVFLDVGNEFGGNANPSSTIVDINATNNLSIGDVFDRDDVQDLQARRVTLNNTSAIAFDCSHALQLGSYERTAGLITELLNNTDDDICTVATSRVSGFKVSYSLKRDDAVRTGELTVSLPFGSNSLIYSDDYTQTAATGVTLYAQVNGVSGDIEVRYTTTDTSSNVDFNYSIVRFIR